MKKITCVTWLLAAAPAVAQENCIEGATGHDWATLGWATDDGGAPAVTLTGDAAAETRFDLDVTVTFADTTTTWSTGPHVAPAGTSIEVPLDVPLSAMQNPRQLEVLTWVGVAATATTPERGATRTTHAWLTLGDGGVGLLTPTTADRVAPGGAYVASSLAELAAAASEPDVLLELGAGRLAAPPAPEDAGGEP